MTRYCRLLGVLLFGILPGRLRAADPLPPEAVVPAPQTLDSQVHAQLEANLHTALWMQSYDQVAWKTTDLLLKEDKETLKKIGPVWFCIEKDKIWYALYGMYEAPTFRVTICYRKDSIDKFEKVTPPDFPDKDRFARALVLTLPEILDTTRRTTVRFNYYVRAEDGKIAIYYIPAFQTDGKLAYGIQHTFVVSKSGDTVVSHERHGNVLIGSLLRKDRTITLETPECLVPTPQAMFTMMNYREYFADIVTHCQAGYFNMGVQNGAFFCKPTYQPAPDHSWQ